MTTMTATGPDPVIDVRETAPAGGPGQPLLAAQAEAGALVAALMERPSAWPQVLPLAADLASRARRAADLVAGGTAHADAAMTADAAVPAVVWARELACAQRLLRRALGRVHDEGQIDERTAETLTVAAREMRALARELAGLTWAVG